MVDTVSFLRAEIARLMNLMIELRESGNAGLAAMLEDVAAKYLRKLADEESARRPPHRDQRVTDERELHLVKETGAAG
jgi:hypothetical protein